MYEFRTLNWEELDAWFDHCAGVFSQDEHIDGMRRYFMNHWYNDSRRKLDGIFVAMDGESIASTVRVFHRLVYCNGQVVAMGGIGEVSTKPAYRRQGLSGKLLEMAILYMKKSGMAISALGTGIPGHYAKYGWREVRSYNSQRSLLGQRDTDIKLMDWDNPRELHQVMSCYDQYAENFNGTMVRDELYWNRWIRTEASRGWVLKQNGDVTAYLLANRVDDEVRVVDFGTRTKDTEAFCRLSAHAVWSHNLDSAKLRFPTAIGAALPDVETEVKNGRMYRLIAPALCGLESEADLERFLHGGEVNERDTKLYTAPIDSF